MADPSPFPELSFEDLETLVNVDPEFELTKGSAAARESFPFGVSPRLDFMLGDFALNDGGFIPLIDNHDSLAQWSIQTCLHEKFESPLVSEIIGLQVRDRIGEIITNGLMVQIALQVPAALKAHDRITKVFVQRVFAIGNDIYLMVRYETDDDVSTEFLVQVEG